MRGTRPPLFWATMVLVAVFPGCVQATDPEIDDPVPFPQAATIETTNGRVYSPAEVHVGSGAMVTWRSDSGLLHSVTPVGHDLWEEVESDSPGEIFLVIQFLTPGVYDFECVYHKDQGMVGQVVVYGAGGGGGEG